MYHRWAYRTVGKRASHIVTISEFCHRDIVRRLGVPAGRVCVAPPGLDPEFVAAADPSGGRLRLPASYLLAVAGSYPHKRLPIVLEAFALVARERPDLHLVLAGTHPGEPRIIPALIAAAERKGLADRLRVLPRLERFELPELFRRACSLISASEFEGFGIPILEAMAVACPVAASPAEGVVEVLGGHGWVADDFSALALAGALQRALTARREAPAVLKRAMERARSRYTW